VETKVRDQLTTAGGGKRVPQGSTSISISRRGIAAEFPQNSDAGRSRSSWCRWVISIAPTPGDDLLERRVSQEGWLGRCLKFHPG